MGSFSLLISLALAPVAAKSYWEKSFIYLFMDFLIVSAPLSALVAITILLDPFVRNRPKDWSTEIGIGPAIQRKLRRRLTAAYILGCMAGLGVLTYVFHILDWIPRGL